MGLKEDESLVQENIQEYIHDDNKIVTCKWLSLTLSIPVNSAKLALYQFVKDARQSGNNDDINVTYFVSGFETKECGTKILKCVVVPESHLEPLKQTMDPVTSYHVYSVQKAKLKDYTPLYQADYDICRENAETLSKFSSVSCPWAIRREDNQPVEKQVVKEPSKQTTGDKGKEVPKSTSSSSASIETKDEKKPAPGKKKAGIASMFAAAGKKEKKTDSNAGTTENKNTTSSTKSPDSGSTKKGIQAMFKGQASKAGVKDVKKEKEVSPKQAEETTKTSKQKAQSKTEKAQKQKRSGSDGPQKRKRRRIRDDLFDSSDEEGAKNKEDEDDDDNVDVDVEMSEEEDIISKKDKRKIQKEEEEDSDTEKKLKKEEEEVEEPTQVETIVVKDGKRRKRTRKLVPRQHIDEDGFMVTEKVWESDSTDASDEEETKTATTTTSKPSSTSSSSSPTKARNASKPSAASKKKPAAVSPSKNKQTSLMSFFKKK